MVYMHRYFRLICVTDTKIPTKLMAMYSNHGDSIIGNSLVLDDNAISSAKVKDGSTVS